MLSRQPCLALSAVIALASSPLLVGQAGAFKAAFLGDLPAETEALVERCVELQDCEGLDRLNAGPQYFTLSMWGRTLSNDLLVEVAGDALVVDASALADLIDQYYVWPAQVSRTGRIDLHELPGITLTRDGMTIAVAPHEAYAPKLHFGYRVVRPDEFEVPGYAVFGQVHSSVDLDVSGHHGHRREPRTRTGATVGAQAGLWQLHLRGSFASEDARTRFDYGYVDRPILSHASRLRAGYMPTLSGCRRCVSGTMVGVSVASDSLNGLLYRPGDTAFLEVDVEGDVDELEIFVNGRSVRREAAFPGRHTVAVTALEDGPNAIEIFGVNRASGARRLLVATTQNASVSLLADSTTERWLQMGWATSNHPYFAGEDFDIDAPFLQYEQKTGLGDGRQLDFSTVFAPRGMTGEGGLTFRIGEGRASMRAIGSFSGGGPGGGVGAAVSQRFDWFSFGASGDVCFDCFNASTFAVEDGLTAHASAALSAWILGWSATGAVHYSSFNRDSVRWRADLSRNVFGGRLSLFAQDTAGWRRDLSLTRHPQVGFQFTRVFGGPRIRTAEVGLESHGDSVVPTAKYTDRPRGGEGVFMRASAEGNDLRTIDAGKTTLSAGIGYQDRLVSGVADIKAHDGATSLRADAASGFVFADGQFVVGRSILNGGIFAGGLTPNTPVYVDDRQWGQVNTLGQLHLPGIRSSKPVRVDVDEGLLPTGASQSREARLLPVPGRFYGIGDRYRRLERSYRLLVGRDRAPIAPGTLLRNAEGEIIGAAGYDGMITLTGRPGPFVFNPPEQTCRGTYTGEEPGQELTTIYAKCEPL